MNKLSLQPPERGHLHMWVWSRWEAALKQQNMKQEQNIKAQDSAM